ncbi:hypothetical protein [Nocardioides cavernaquae]|uniref:Uncharacterized protein n=1 Tax=Nocardioides cavernaquae TaxID=2321396 RepID=A0A3A5HAA3_9ACTN|nr:hypothetical protein [Nocardioides cavernaquae]RJS47566.1 hypothetical protein D4739_16000 [Nocardioides cavernaquae]
MSWLALLLIGVGVTDLVFSVRPARIVPECTGALVALVVGVGCDLTEPRDIAALIVIVVVVTAWGQTVTRGFARGGRPWIPLALLGLALVGAIVVAPGASHAGGLLGEWLARDPLPVLADVGADRLLLLAGLVLVQLSTGNVLVRLVLAVTGTMSPAQHGTSGDPEMRLKGGRLLGPMERLVILGLGLAGQLTAAGIVIAAKGLLRFPELQSRSEQVRIHQLTEYFLVGSFVSWLIPLTSLVLLRT